MKTGNRSRFSPRANRYSNRDLKALSLTIPALKKKRKRNVLPLFLVALLLVLGSLALHPFRGSGPERKLSCPVPVDPVKLEPGESWEVISELLFRRTDSIPGGKCIDIFNCRSEAYTIHTSLDPEYQAWVESRLRRSMALAGAAVIMHPSTGRIVSLAVFNADPAQPQAFFWKAYPAASVFKVVTASAAVDLGILTPDSVLDYTGAAHTLYRKHLSSKTYSWSNRVSLEKAFARSINPVFGKIGIHRLGREALQDYSSAYFFNAPLPCEVPQETGRIQVPEDDMGIAEVASGFNRETVISPVQAAWIASIIAGEGSAPAPWIVKSIEARSGFTAPPLDHQDAAIRVLPKKSAQNMQRLMEATIRSGTCRKSFGRRNRYRYLRPLTFGGKTGNINNREDTVKYDWFVGYARGPDTENDLAVSVLMFHGEKLGHRANVMAFDLMRGYFRQMNAREKKRSPSS
jgi:peptidoglycan glycosyltransferase